jgi:hypothetical protein
MSVIGMLISNIDIAGDTIGDTFSVSIEISAICFTANIACYIGDTFKTILQRYSIQILFVDGE